MKQLAFIFLGPSAVVVNISPDIGGVAIDYIFIRGLGNHLVESPSHELPLRLDETSNILDLVDNFCDVGSRESLWLLAKWYIPLTTAIESHHAVETGAGKKQKVKRIESCIETVSDRSEMRVPVFRRLFELTSLPFQVFPNQIRRNLVVLDSLIEPDDVRVDIAEKGFLESGIERDDPRAKEWLDPSAAHGGR